MTATRPRTAAYRHAFDPLNPIELIDYTRLVAEEVAAGRYPFIEYDEEERWHQRVYRDRRVDLWLISWLPSQGTQLHDHGGSSGAFTVISGELSEAIYRPGHSEAAALAEHRRSAGAGIGFGDKYVHDVRNLGSEPAVSVHAYSPPLTTMNFYDVDSTGSLQRLATLDTEGPEPQLALPGSAPAA
jgi:hypothetical protein